jgi:hypothetical protein
MNLFIAVVLFCAMAGIVTAATVTQNINYQGKLTDASGNPLTGTYSIQFRLYEFESGGSALASSLESVQCTNGLFTVSLPFAATRYNGRALWLGIAVGSDAEMTPRQEIRPVPYALSLRPGAYIVSNDGSAALNLHNSNGGSALSLITQYIGVPALDISTSTYTGSTGVNVNTAGENSNGAKIKTTGTNSDGIYVENTGSNSYGVNVSTTQFGSPGFYAATTGDSSQGLAANTWGSNSPGIDVGGWGSGNSYGVKAYSQNSAAIYASTAVEGETGWGLLTPNYIRAKGSQFPTADVAEYMPATDDVSPGTVMIISDDGKLTESTTAYDTRVAGIVSTEPGVLLGSKDTGNPGEEQIAIGGRVPCKVDATKAPIHAGDLLTTSDLPGHAMKAEPDIINGKKYYPDGTVLGKAMGTLENGTGVIEVLVTLQ